MSSLAATQADGYYIPSEYYDSGQINKKTRNQIAKSKGHNQYLQKGIVRFELPFNGFCKGCGAHVSKGTRFNAQKTKVSNYFTTPIYEFQMKCRVCAKVEFCIRTNPQERSFDFVDGIHKQVQEFDTNDAGTAGVIDTEYGNKIVSATSFTSSQQASSALDHLDRVASGQRKSLSEHDQLQALIQINDKTYQHDASRNADIRADFRVDRRAKKNQAASRVGWREGMELDSEDTTDDLVESQSTTFCNGKVQEATNFRQLRSSSIFTALPLKKRRRRFHIKAEPDPDTVPSTGSPSTRQSRDAAGLDTPEPDSVPKQRTKVILRPSSTGSILVEKLGTALEQSAPRDQESALISALACYSSDSD